MYISFPLSLSCTFNFRCLCQGQTEGHILACIGWHCHVHNLSTRQASRAPSLTLVEVVSRDHDKTMTMNHTSSCWVLISNTTSTPLLLVYSLSAFITQLPVHHYEHSSQYLLPLHSVREVLSKKRKGYFFSSHLKFVLREGALLGGVEVDEGNDACQ